MLDGDGRDMPTVAHHSEPEAGRRAHTGPPLGRSLTDGVDPFECLFSHVRVAVTGRVQPVIRCRFRPSLVCSAKPSRRETADAAVRPITTLPENAHTAVLLRDLRPDGVVVLTFNRPERNNAWNLALEEAYFAALTDATADPAVRAIVVTGAGRAFCPGMDFQRLAAPSSPRYSPSRSVCRERHLLAPRPAGGNRGRNGPAAVRPSHRRR